MWCGLSGICQVNCNILRRHLSFVTGITSRVFPGSQSLLTSSYFCHFGRLSTIVSKLDGFASRKTFCSGSRSFFFFYSHFFLWHDILTLIRKKFPVTRHQLCLWERSLWQIRFSLQMCKLHGILQLSRYYNPIHFQILKDRLPQLEQKNTAIRNFIYDAVTSKLACKWRISSLYYLILSSYQYHDISFFKKTTVICWVIST